MKIAVIGCGHWGKNLARNFAEMNALACIVDPNLGADEREFAGVKIPILSLEQALNNKDIGAVAIATPAETHHAIAMQAIGHGKHVFVEKPLSLDVETAEEVIEAAKHAGVVLMVGHLLQYHPVFVTLRDMVSAGDLGKIRYAYSNRLSMGKFRVNEDVVWSLAPHDISMLLALFPEFPTNINCNKFDFITENIADEARIDMDFSGMAHAHVFVSWLHPNKEQKLIVVGELGMAVFDDVQPWEQKLSIFRHGIDVSGREPVPLKRDPEYVFVEHGEPLREECKHFIESCVQGVEPFSNGVEALNVLRVMQIATQE